MTTGRLILCATPIGNLDDASPRLAQTLREADVVYAEDTRRSGGLLAALGVEADLRSFFVGNERSRSRQLESDLRSGRTVAVVTDAGTPAVSDPGALAVAAARSAGAEVRVVPGPSAVTAAVAGSGMVDGAFVFEGFLPRKGGERGARLAAVAAEQRPVVLFLAPHRIDADLADLAEACGAEREVCVARELTKLYEEWWWGRLGEAAERWAGHDTKGEVTVVVAGAEAPPPDLDEAVRVAEDHLEAGSSPSQAARRAAAETGADRREIYAELLSRRAEGDQTWS